MGRYDLDSDTSTIRCLSHVIHLAITDLLVGLKAVKKTDVREDDIDLGDLTEEMAEEIGFGTGNDEDGGVAVSPEQEQENEVEIDGSVFAKVRCHTSHL